MERNRKNTIIIIIALVISIVGLGIAFAAFSTTLMINGSASVEASSWNVVFEGTSSTTAISKPTLTGSAKEITRPTIKNNSTEISNYSVSLATPGDSVTYKFKIHNKGDYAADVSTLTIAGVTNPTGSVSGANLVTDSSIATANSKTLNVTQYRLYYTDSNATVGLDDAKDCLEPGETVNVTLKIWFSSTYASNPDILPSSDLTLDNLGVSILYNQHANGYCYYDGGERETVTNVPFENIGGTYYTYEGKRFIGTGVDNVIITENVISSLKYTTKNANKCSDGSTPTNNQCPSGTTPVFDDHPALDRAIAYCTGCRLMTKAEATSWGCSTNNANTPKCSAKYNGSTYVWWLADFYSANSAWSVTNGGYITNSVFFFENGVRPVVDISSSATMTGSGTSQSPYAITLSQ